MSYPDGVLALVTGGASGIGAAAAARLRADRVRVVTADRAPGADERLDVTDPAAVAALVDCIGTVGILVHCAGIVAQQGFAHFRPVSDLIDTAGRIFI